MPHVDQGIPESFDRYLPLRHFREFHKEVAYLKRRIVELSKERLTEGDFDPVVASVDAGEIRSKLIQRLERFQDEARERLSGPRLAEHQQAVYVMAVLADEIFIYLDWPGAEGWSEHLIETSLFQTHLGGEELFDRLDEILRVQDPAAKPLATVYFYALTLGFEGRYRDSDSPDPQRRRNEAYRFITGGSAGVEDEALFPQAYLHLHTGGGRRPVKLDDVRRWLSYAVAGLVVWLVVSHLLWRNLSRVLRAETDAAIAAAANVPRSGSSSPDRTAAPAAAPRPFWSRNPALTLALVLAILAAAVLVYWLLKRVSAPDEDKKKTLEALLFRVRSDFLSGIEDIKQTAGGDRSLYASPWYLRIDSGSEAGTGDAEHPVRWEIDERGHTICVAPRDLGSSANAPAWDLLLQLIDDYRYRRPLDGILVVCSAASLAAARDGQAAGLDVLRRDGAEARKMLERLCGRLQSRLPVYLVFSHAEKLIAFRGFERAIPDEKKRQMMGWSSPHLLDEAFSKEWVQEAFETIDRRLFSLELDYLRTGEASDDRDKLFMFRTGFQTLEEAATVWSSALLSDLALEGSLIVRGLYLVAEPSDAEQSSSGGALAGRRRGPLFFPDLLERKILPERTIAVPLKRSFLGSRMSVKLAMFATAAAVFMTAGALLSYDSVREDASGLTTAMRMVRSGLEAKRRKPSSAATQTPAPPSTDESAYESAILKQLARIDTNRIGSPFMPTAYLSPLDGRIIQAISYSFEHLTLDSLREGLIIKAKIVVSPSSPEQEKYLASLTELERYIDVYNGLLEPGEGTLETASDLATYVGWKAFTGLPESFYSNERYYRLALQRVSSTNRLDPWTYSKEIFKKLEQLAQKQYREAFGRSTFQTRLHEVASQVKNFAATDKLLEGASPTRKASLKKAIRALAAELQSDQFALLASDSYVTSAMPSLYQFAADTTLLNPPFSAETYSEDKLNDATGRNQLEQIMKTAADLSTPPGWTEPFVVLENDSWGLSERLQHVSEKIDEKPGQDQAAILTRGRDGQPWI